MSLRAALLLIAAAALGGCGSLGPYATLPQTAAPGQPAG